jgi:hypothetical protein
VAHPCVHDAITVIRGVVLDLDQSNSSSIASSTAHVAAALPSFTMMQGSENSASERIALRIVDLITVCTSPATPTRRS